MIYRYLVLPSNFLFLNSASYTEIDRVTFPRSLIHTKKSDFGCARDYWLNTPDAQRNDLYCWERYICWGLLSVNKQVYEEASQVMRNEAELCIDVDQRFMKRLHKDRQLRSLRSRKADQYLSEIPVVIPRTIHSFPFNDPNPLRAMLETAKPLPNGPPSQDLLSYLVTFRHLNLQISGQLSSADLARLSPLMTAVRDARHHKLHITITTTRSYNPYDDMPSTSAKSRGMKRLLSGLRVILRDLGGSSRATVKLRIIDQRHPRSWKLDLGDLLETFTIEEWESQIQDIVEIVRRDGHGIEAESWAPDRGPRDTWEAAYYSLGYREQQSHFPKRISSIGDIIEEQDD